MRLIIVDPTLWQLTLVFLGNIGELFWARRGTFAESAEEDAQGKNACATPAAQLRGP